MGHHKCPLAWLLPYCGRVSTSTCPPQPQLQGPLSRMESYGWLRRGLIIIPDIFGQCGAGNRSQPDHKHIRSQPDHKHLGHQLSHHHSAHRVTHYLSHQLHCPARSTLVLSSRRSTSDPALSLYNTVSQREGLKKFKWSIF